MGVRGILGVWRRAMGGRVGAHEPPRGRLDELDEQAAALIGEPPRRFGAPDSDILVFLHIAKTAGSTFSPIFTRQFAPEMFFNTNLAESRSALGVFPEAPIERKLASLAQSEKARIRYVGGHLLFGIHRLLPRPARYITVLRDPVDRVISSYYYIRRTPGIPVSKAILEGGLSLEDYVRSGLGLDPHNYQTRILAGLPELDATWERTREVLAKPIDSSALERAKENLDLHFEVVGLTEAFDEFLALCALRLGWRPSSLVYDRRNVTGDRPELSAVPASTIELIRDSNRLDQALYDHAKRLFERAARDAEPALGELVTLSRRANAEPPAAGEGG